MAKKVSRRLVIDASVARSATLSDNPTSTACREFLQAILDVCHRIVLSAEIYREWEHHALRTETPADVRRTRFLANWLVAMSRRKGGRSCGHESIEMRHCEPRSTGSGFPATTGTRSPKMFISLRPP